ncbi:Cc8K15.2-like protein [Daphnia magna]|uniref:Cc8K15.2-like protein n=1 Tax=Daphnia magna TaxID=35525 RepID=A0A164JVC4_9CRUS|nr:Cc8K15.2-like protein [Daphnia magna]
MIASRESFWEEDYNFFCGQWKFPQIGAMGAIDGKKRTRDRKRNQRWNLSISDDLAVQAAFTKKGGGNLNDVLLSVATVSRHRRQNREEISNQIREKFVKPSFLLIHWDSKLIRYLTGKKDERVAILISGKLTLDHP